MSLLEGQPRPFNAANDTVRTFPDGNVAGGADPDLDFEFGCDLVAARYRNGKRETLSQDQVRDRTILAVALQICSSA